MPNIIKQLEGEFDSKYGGAPVYTSLSTTIGEIKLSSDIKDFIFKHAIPKVLEEVRKGIKEFEICLFESDGEVHTCYSCASGTVENCKKCKRDRCSNVHCRKGGKGSSIQDESYNDGIDSVSALLTTIINEIKR